MEKVFEEFTDFFKKKGFLTCINFNDSLATDRIYNSFKIRGLPIKEDLLLLYNWKNGIQLDKNYASDEHWIITFGIFLSLEDASNQYDKVISTYLKRGSYFPIFADNLGEYYLYDFNAKDENPKIFFYSPAMLILKPVPVFLSIERMFKSILECFIKGAFFYTSNCIFERNIKKSREILHELNPEYPYWKEEGFVSYEEEE